MGKRLDNLEGPRDDLPTNMETKLENGTNETMENTHVVESFGSFCLRKVAQVCLQRAIIM